MTGEPRRVGPWLRRYGEREAVSRRERLVQIGLTAAGGVLVLGLALGVLWLFLQAPVHTLGGLIALWGIGFAVLLIKRRRAAAMEQALEAQARGDDPRASE